MKKEIGRILYLLYYFDNYCTFRNIISYLI